MAAGRPFITANQVTLARIACIPLPCWLLYQGKTGQLLAVILGTLIAVGTGAFALAVLYTAACDRL